MELHAQIACSLPRDPRMRAAGPLARLVYIEAFLYCRENLTDGIIDRLNLPFIAVDVQSKTKHLARLVDVGALEVIPEGWRFPPKVWRKWNPTRAEVDEKRAAEARRKADYRARRRAESGDGPVDVPTGQRVASWDTRKQPEPEPEPEPEPITTSPRSLREQPDTQGDINATIHTLAERFRA